jgi:hypothetical protein
MEKELKLNYSVPITEYGLMDSEFIINGIAINATVTANNHKFLAEELKTSAETLTGVPLLVDHRNEIDAIKGRVIIGEFDGENSRVNFKAKVVDNEIQRMIKQGLINSVSVGAAVREIEEDNEVLIPRGITFKELSLVAVPADAGATFGMAVGEAFKLQESMRGNEKVQVVTEVTNQTNNQGIPPYIKPKVEKTEVSQSLKGGQKMEAETKTETIQAIDYSAQLKEMSEAMKALKEELKSLSAKKEEVKEVAKAEVKEEAKVEEELVCGKYRIVQSHGDLRGGAFTILR